MTFWFAIRARGDGKWLTWHSRDMTEGAFVSERAHALRWGLDDEREVRDLALLLPIAVDVVSISDAP